MEERKSCEHTHTQHTELTLMNNSYIANTCLPPLTAGPVSSTSNDVAQPADGRASLLESIRSAGGIGKAKLRNVKERKMEKKKQKEQEQGVRAF